MSNNPYLAWPLWHWFTMNSQNIDSLGADIDSIRGIVAPILVDGKRVSSVPAEKVSDIDAQDAVSGGEVLAKRKDDIVLYDFIEDKIVRLSTFDVPVYALIVGVKMTAIPPTAITIYKGGRTKLTPNGGDIVPIVGTYTNMQYIIQLISNTINGRPYDIRERLTDEEREKVKDNLSAPIYHSTSIKRILDSYESCNATPSSQVATVDTNRINNIRSRISNMLTGKKPAGRAINIESGQYINSTHDRTIMEFKVRLDPNSPPINVKFSFPQNLPLDKRQQYIEMLKKNFHAEQVHTPITEERKATELNPVHIQSSSISSIFGEPEKFSSYIAKVNALERTKTLDISSTLSSLPTRPISEEIEEEEENYEED